MKYQLTQLIQALNKEEVRNFKLFSAKYKSKGTKGLILLFDTIRKGNFDEYDERIIDNVLPGSTKNNYYRLKNRLIQAVEDSLADLYRKKDKTFEIFRLLRLAKIFFYKSDYHKSKRYLDEAEKIALKQENYAALHPIYKEYATLVSNLSSINPSDYIQRKRKYNKIHEKIEENKFLMAAISYQMRTTNFSGKNKDVHAILDAFMEQLKVTDELKDSASVRFDIDKCVRQSLLQRKEFNLLADYLEQTIQKFTDEGLFTAQYHRNKIVMLTWTINTTVKIKQYNRALIYVEVLRASLEEFNQMYLKQFYWIYQTSKFVITSYAGDNKKSIELAEQALSKNNLTMKHPHGMAFYLNLSTVYYQGLDLSKALEYLSTIIADPSFNTLAPAWKINLKIVEIIYHTEAENFDYAKNIYDNIKRSNRELLKEDGYKREAMFLNILREIIQIPQPFKNEKTIKKVREFLDTFPDFEPAANEGINYNIWLTSKMKNSSYYQELITQ